jgi:hypothetical protein
MTICNRQKHPQYKLEIFLVENLFLASTTLPGCKASIKSFFQKFSKQPADLSLQNNNFIFNIILSKKDSLL